MTAIVTMDVRMIRMNARFMRLRREAAPGCDGENGTKDECVTHETNSFEQSGLF